jgi:hypothetical protein
MGTFSSTAAVASATPELPDSRRNCAGQATSGTAGAILACDNPEAIVLDFMQPQVAGRQLVGLCGKARCDEAGREGTLHVG